MHWHLWDGQGTAFSTRVLGIVGPQTPAWPHPSHGTQPVHGPLLSLPAPGCLSACCLASVFLTGEEDTKVHMHLQDAMAKYIWWNCGQHAWRPPCIPKALQVVAVTVLLEFTAVTVSETHSCLLVLQDCCWGSLGHGVQQLERSP